MKKYILNTNSHFTCEATANEDGSILQAIFRVNGYWGTGITLRGVVDRDAKEPCSISYASGGYETNPDKFKVYDNSRMNVIRAENLAEALKYAAYLAYWTDEGQAIGSYRLPFEEEINPVGVAA